MIMFKLGYGSREMAMLKVNAKRRYPKAFEAFEEELRGSALACIESPVQRRLQNSPPFWAGAYNLLLKVL